MITKFPLLFILLFLFAGMKITLGQNYYDFNQMSNKLTQLDQDGNYKEIFQILLKWMNDYPGDIRGIKMINNVYHKYYSKVMGERELIEKIIPYLEKPKIGELKGSLQFFYTKRDEAGVDSVLNEIVEADSGSIDITENYLTSSFNPAIDTALYLKIFTALSPYLRKNLSPGLLVIFYNLNQMQLLKNYLAKVHLDTAYSYVPLNAIESMNPSLDHDVFIKIFPFISTDLIRAIEQDSLVNDSLLCSVAMQFYSIGDTLHTAVIFKKISGHIKLNESSLPVIFCWGVACLFEGQIYKGDQFLNKVFTYSNEIDVAEYKKTLEIWGSLGVQSDYISSFLNNFSPGTRSNIIKKPVSIESAVKKDNITFGEYYALIIGVEKYADSTIQSLQNPVRDANRIKNILTLRYTFKENNVTVLENPDRNTIVTQLNRLRKLLTGETDNLLIFYAGHGYWDEEIGQGYWLPADSRSGDISNWISNSDLRDYLRGIKSKHTLLISDACFAGGIFKARDININDNSDAIELYKLLSRSALTSGTIKEVPDKSVFLDYLLKRLEQNNTKYLIGKELFYSFRDAVISNSPNQQRPVYGTIYNAGDEGGDFIFVKKDTKK